MNFLLPDGLPPEQQRLLMEQMYILLGNQVKSYHKHRHMGDNTSVPTELARDLMASMTYTLDLAGGVLPGGNLESTLTMGQALLKTRMQKAKDLLQLVMATAPRWQTKCRWEALRYLSRYLEGYDRLHLAHKGPGGLFYPILVSMPEYFQGIDECLFYLQVLWQENQIMAGVDEALLDQLWDRLPSESLNQCEQLLLNGFGKMLLTSDPDSLLFSEEDHRQLFECLQGTTLQDLSAHLNDGANRFFRWIRLTDPNAVAYARSIIGPLCSRLEQGPQVLPHIFL